MDAGCVCVAGAALEHVSLILRGRRSTWSTSVSFLRGKCSTWRDVRRSPARIEYCGRRLRLRGGHSTWSTSASFCVAGAALGAPQSHFARQVLHAEHLSFILRGGCSTRSTCREVRGSPATIEYRYGKL